MIAAIPMIALVAVIVVLAVTLLVLWDRLVGAAFVGFSLFAVWIVSTASGRWWFWPTTVLAAVAVTGALIVAVLISVPGLL